MINFYCDLSFNTLFLVEINHFECIFLRDIGFSWICDEFMQMFNDSEHKNRVSLNDSHHEIAFQPNK